MNTLIVMSVIAFFVGLCAVVVAAVEHFIPECNENL